MPMAAKTRPLTRRDLVGYALGDLGGGMTFAVMGSFLTPYYLEVAGLSMTAVSLLYFVLRIWDALIGVMLDRSFVRRGGAGGKFRPWMRLAAPLLFLSGVLVFTMPHRISGMGRAAAAFITYLLYVTSYNLFNIPYGSLLSAMGSGETERARLSSARGFGAMIGNLVPLALFPLMFSNPAIRPELAYGGGILACAGLGLAACLLSCRWTREPGTPAIPQKNETNWRDLAAAFVKNRPFTAVSLTGLFYCVNQYMVSTLSIYMFRDVFGALPLFSVMTMLNMGCNALVLAAAPRVV